MSIDENLIKQAIEKASTEIARHPNNLPYGIDDPTVVCAVINFFLKLDIPTPVFDNGKFYAVDVYLMPFLQNRISMISKEKRRHLSSVISQTVFAAFEENEA